MRERGEEEKGVMVMESSELGERRETDTLILEEERVEGELVRG